MANAPNSLEHRDVLASLQNIQAELGLRGP